MKLIQTLMSSNYAFQTVNTLPMISRLLFNVFTIQVLLYNYITSVFHCNVTIGLVMKWSHDYIRYVLHPNKTQTRNARASMTTSNVNNQWRSNFQE
jgi:hypothetical protein